MYPTPKPIVPWIGGKRRLARVLLPMFPAHVCYVEPFCGAAALFFRKAPSSVEVLNDTHGELINLYRVVKHHFEEFLRQFKWALTSRQIFEWHTRIDPATLTDVQRAARFYYLQKLKFGAKVTGNSYGTATIGGGRLNLLRIEEDLGAAHLRLHQVNIEHLPWQRCVERYDRPHTLFFCDPPYWQTNGYGDPFPLPEYEQLAEAARSSKGAMIVTVNDHPDMRRVFAGLDITSAAIRYTVGGSHRPQQATELIIRNPAACAPKGDSGG